MRIVHYYAAGEVLCGVLDGQGQIRGFAGVGELEKLTAREQLRGLLTMGREERAGVNERVLARGPVARARAERLAPAIPDPPLYYYLHGNAPTVWKRQQGGKAMWEGARSPHNRIRPWTSLAGHGQELEMAQGAQLSSGTEFAVVIGKPARGVGQKEAAEHIAGVVGTNDGFLWNLHNDFDTNGAGVNSVHTQALHTLAKSADGMGGVGPCIVTVEELERDLELRAGTDRRDSMRTATGRMACLYDLLTRNYRDGQCVDRAHTGAMLLDAEYLIAYLSRFMTLQTGSIIGLGSAGWDGQLTRLGDAAGAVETQEYEIEDYGRYQVRLVRTAGPHAERRESPLLATRRKLGLPEMPTEAERTTRSLWMARGNARDGGAVDNVPEQVGLCPFLLPWSAMGDAEAALVIPAHATDVEVSVQLAMVVGERAIYNVTAAEALEGMAGWAVMLAVRDRSLVDCVPNMTDYEARPAHLAGYYGDGFCRVGRMLPRSAVKDWRGLTMEVFSSGGSGVAVSRSADYRFGPEHMIAMIARTITLLPGDVLSLGRVGAVLTLPAKERVKAGMRVGVRIVGLSELQCVVEDQRDEKAQQGAAGFLTPTR